MKAIVFGEIIWDVYPDQSVIGGAAFNFGAHMAHLGDEVYLLSAVGSDSLGEAAMGELARHGVRDELMQTNSYPTGACTVTLNAEKIPSYHVHGNVAYDHIKLTDREIEKIVKTGADLIYFNTLCQRGEASRRALRTLMGAVNVRERFCDVNLRTDCFDADSLGYCLSHATTVKVSDEEAHFIYELGLLEKSDLPFERALAARYPNLRLVLYTLGGDGSRVYEAASGKTYESGKPKPVRVVSTVGAGDCYGASFLHAYLANGDIENAIALATERSGFVVSQTAAVPFEKEKIE
jgi:fructokinase